MSSERTTPSPLNVGREDRGVARHREPLERLARHAGQRVEHVRLAGVVEHVVEEGAELRADELGRLVGDVLHDVLEPALGHQRGRDPVRGARPRARRAQALPPRGPSRARARQPRDRPPEPWRRPARSDEALLRESATPSNASTSDLEPPEVLLHVVHAAAPCAAPAATRRRPRPACRSARRCRARPPRRSAPNACSRRAAAPWSAARRPAGRQRRVDDRPQPREQSP